MSFNTTALNSYVDQNRKELLAALVAGSNTFDNDFVLIREGIKGGSAQEMKFFSNTIEWQTGNCPSTASGSTTFTVKNLSTTLFNAYDEWCPDDLSGKFPVLLKAGASNQLDAGEAIVNNIVEQAKRDVAIAAWQGLYNTSGTGDMAGVVSGWLRKLINTSYSSSTFTVDGTYTSFSSGTAIAIVDDLMANVPTAIYGKQLELHLSPAFYNTLKIALRDSSAIAFNFADGSTDEFTMPGYDNLRVKRDDGLAGSKAVVVTFAGNLVLGTDLVSDQDNIRFGHDDRVNKDWYRMAVAIGTEIAFPEHVGVYVSA